MNSKALKKLKKEAEKPEWVFKVHTKPPGLTVIHYDETHVFSEKELRDLIKGFVEKEYVWRGKIDEEVFEFTPILLLKRYRWLPKYLYSRFMRGVCEALGIPFSRQIVEGLIAEPETPVARVVIPEKKPWDLHLGRTKELEEKYERVFEEIDALEKFFKETKKK